MSDLEILFCGVFMFVAGWLFHCLVTIDKDISDGKATNKTKYKVHGTLAWPGEIICPACHRNTYTEGNYCMWCSHELPDKPAKM